MEEEFCELLHECSKANDKILEWYGQHKDCYIFQGEDGEKLKRHIAEMCKNEAFCFLTLGIMTLKDYLNEVSKES